jgi:hypothetical protein
MFKSLENLASLIRQESITESDWKIFIDEGFVRAKILLQIAKRIINRESMNERELTIFYAKTKEINQIITDIQKTC